MTIRFINNMTNISVQLRVGSVNGDIIHDSLKPNETITISKAIATNDVYFLFTANDGYFLPTEIGRKALRDNGTVVNGTFTGIPTETVSWGDTMTALGARQEVELTGVAIIDPNFEPEVPEEPEEPEVPEEPEEPEVPEEPKHKWQVQNYNVRNAYVDTSYIRFVDGAVIVSNFSSDDENKQEVTIENNLRVTAKDGYKFDLNNLDDYYFDVQFQSFNGSQVDYNSSLPFTRVKLSEFVPVTDISSYEWIEQRIAYQLYKSIDKNGSMYYTYTVGNTTHLILLYGGLREKDLVFFTFTNTNYSEDFTMNGVKWVTRDSFAHDGYNVELDDNLSVSFLNNLNFVAIPSTQEPIEDTTNYLFNTYYIDNSDLSRLKENSGLASEVIINTYSYPINFTEDDLVEVDFSVANISQSIHAKRFLKNNTEVEIFKFTVPDIPDVKEVRIRIPFNNDVTLLYEDIKGKTVTGRFVYEVLTNTTTLFINDGVSDIYKNMVGIGVTVPYKPTGQYSGGNDPTTRLAVDTPKMFIKGVGKTVKGNYIQGVIGKVVENMLGSEREKLNSLLKNGVYFND